MINAVEVVMDLFELPSDQAAVVTTQALYLQIKIETDSELERLISEDALIAQQWRFIDAVLHSMSDNVFAPTVMSRYGAKSCRLSRMGCHTGASYWKKHAKGRGKEEKRRGKEGWGGRAGRERP